MSEPKTEIVEDIRSVSDDSIGPNTDNAAPTAGSLHNSHFEEFLSDKLFFRPQDGHHNLEVRVSDGVAFLHEEEVKEAAVSAWVRDCQQDDSCTPLERPATRLKMLVFAPRPDRKSAMPLPVTPATLRHIFETLGFPKVVLRVLLSGLPMALPFDPKLRAGSEGSVGLILRTDAFAFAQYTACLIHDARTHRTTAICIGLRAGEYNHLKTYLAAALSLSASPLFLPFVLVDFMKQSMARWLTYNRLSLLSIANSEEVNVREAGDVRGRAPDLHLDLDAATRKLTFLNDEYSIIRSITLTHLRFLDVFERLLTERHGIAAAADAVTSRASAGLLDEMPYLRESFKSALQYIDRDMSNIQGLAQTTYCLIAQKESRQNLLIAEASMKIAAESKRIAVWTRRDSTDMRIITAITLVFLPATFTATLLGSNLFNFQLADETAIVASKSWIYWVVTAVLTLLVMTTWWLVSRVQEKRMYNEFPGDHASLGRRGSGRSPEEITGFWTSRGASGIWAAGGRREFVLGSLGDASVTSVGGSSLHVPSQGDCGGGCGG